MNEFDPLEVELAALRPHGPTAELKQRIAERLDDIPVNLPARPRKYFGKVGAVAGGVIAAGLLAMIFVRRGDEAVEPLAPHVPVAETAAAFDDTLPSLWTYRTALARSPDAVDALLDRHSAGTTESKPGRARVYFFARYDSDLNPLAGEL
jgi:hypothetical protein